MERLRDRAYAFKSPDPLSEEAANEIERLRNAQPKCGSQCAMRLHSKE